MSARKPSSELREELREEEREENLDYNETVTILQLGKTLSQRMLTNILANEGSPVDDVYKSFQTISNRDLYCLRKWQDGVDYDTSEDEIVRRVGDDRLWVTEDCLPYVAGNLVQHSIPITKISRRGMTRRNLVKEALKEVPIRVLRKGDSKKVRHTCPNHNNP